MEIKNARITSTELGFDDHGILTAFIILDYGGTGQGFGGYCLAGAAMSIFVKGILEVIEVDNWEDLKGKHVRVKAERNKVHEIGNILKDRWFSPEESFKDLK